MQIATLEGRQAQLTGELEDPAAYEAGGKAMSLNRDLAAVSKDLARLTKEWEAATAELEVSQ
jgi:ATP-binding cassette subfamily F protein 3